MYINYVLNKEININKNSKFNSNDSKQSADDFNVLVYFSYNNYYILGKTVEQALKQCGELQFTY